MSAQAEQPRRDIYRFFGVETTASAGLISIVAVALAGLTLGFFGWYYAVLPLHRELVSEVSLPAGMVAGAIIALWLWQSYSAYFARRAGVKLERALQYDAISWLCWLLLWLSFVLPLGVTHSGRMLAISGALFAVAKLAIAVRFNQTVREVLTDFLISRFAIVVIAELAAVIIGQRTGTHVAESRHLLLAVWGRWDAVHYLDIATKGYHGTNMAFFPLFPLLIAIVGYFTGNHLIAGLVISNVAFFFGLLYLYKLVEHEFDRTVARRAIFYISIFPTAIFFSAVYTESLFLALTVASFYYIRERKWVLAGIIGLLASLTRAEGVLLVVPYLIEWFAAYRAGARGEWKPFLGLALIPLGLVLYMAWLWVLNGDPLYFSHVQIHWNRHLAPPWASVSHAFYAMAHAKTGQIVANQILELTFTALMIGVLLAGWKQLRPSAAAYMALSILIPMSTSSLMSMPRFALVLFPMFSILALWGRRPAINNLIVALSLPLLGLFTVLFADWYWVA
ncbi:MAG: glycosyltransferase family 39 protein [Candidatus Eremiobacteraeota bacterium]|nr:glycosyltransferase family 39 protein [Candidatus Eremiobacteraeota bacterium]